VRKFGWVGSALGDESEVDRNIIVPSQQAKVTANQLLKFDGKIPWLFQ
jgi:hypothetical protein